MYLIYGRTIFLLKVIYRTSVYGFFKVLFGGTGDNASPNITTHFFVILVKNVENVENKQFLIYY